MLNLPKIDMHERLIHGSLLRCTDGHWSTQDALDMSGRKLLALSTASALQRWQDQTPIETIVDDGEGLPDVDGLNAAIPRDEWELGLDGAPRAPWQRQFIAYLLDVDDASLFTFINSTFGAKLAVKKLIDRVGWMRALRGATLFPLIALESRQMKTRFGTKMRPEFTIVDWRDLGTTGEPTRAIEDGSAA